MNKTIVYIILDDTIQAIGLNLLLQKFFGINAAIINELSGIDNSDNASSIFFCSANQYISNQEFFIPRRSRTIILSSTVSNDNNIVDPTLDESSIIEKINSIVETLAVPADEKKQNNLSQREIDVLRLVAMGHINKEIADILNISFNTVLTHRKNISAKLGIKSASGLGFYAIMNGYISESDIRH